MFAALPLMALPVLGYNILVMAILPGGRHASALARLGDPLLVLPAPSGGQWPISLGDLIVFLSLLVLFVELLKSAGSRPAAIINHSLSLILFIGCVVELLLFQAFASTPFFLITVMVLMDLAAGFIVTLRREMETAR